MRKFFIIDLLFKNLMANIVFLNIIFLMVTLTLLVLQHLSFMGMSVFPRIIL
jgi:hypothetical protein